MLTSHLNSFPLTKFILLQDSLQLQAQDCFEFYIKKLAKDSEYQLHYFAFEANFTRVERKLSSSRINCHDCSTQLDDFDSEKTIDILNKIELNSASKIIIVIDSLIHFICRYGLRNTYKFFNNLKCSSDVYQVITVLHKDLQDDSSEIRSYFEFLSTLSITMEETLGSKDQKILSYIFKKPGNKKIINQIEEFWFEEGVLKTKRLEKPDPFVQENVVEPELLSTFKISLCDKDKESRDDSTLPYLLKNKVESSESKEGKIIYTFDNIDDWDEEDPDDDLDI